MVTQVAVIGSGSWGTTLAKIAAENGHDVRLWCRSEATAKEINESRSNERYLPSIKLPPKLTASTSLAEMAQRSVIVFVVPSHGFREVARDMGAHLNGEHVIVHATKGIEQDTYKRMSEILREETPVRKIGVLAGPNLAKELAQKKPAGTLVASCYDEVFRRGHEVFHNNYFRVYGGHDLIGAEIGGTFKNIVALAAGVIDGLKLGDNTKALLLTRGISEMARFGAARGAKIMTFAGMAGFGDLMATCASPFSRNHQVGERLAAGQPLPQILKEMKMVAEGVKATKAVRAFADQHKLDLPIVNAVHRLLYEDGSIDKAIESLMAVRTGQEFDGLSL